MERMSGTVWCQKGNHPVRFGEETGVCVCVGVCAHVHALLQSGARRKKQVVWRWKKGSHRGSYTRCWPGLQNQTFKGTQWELSTMPHPTRSATEAVTQNHEGKNGGLPLPFLGLLLSLGSSAKSLAERSMNSVVILFYSHTCLWSGKKSS